LYWLEPDVLDWPVDVAPVLPAASTNVEAASSIPKVSDSVFIDFIRFLLKEMENLFSLWSMVCGC
jgi:hypothetical protein